MLRALKDQLLQLSSQKEDEFLKILKKRVGSDRAKASVRPLQNFILVMPEMIAQIWSWSQEKVMTESLRSLHGNLLTYLYHPLDFIHDEKHGFFGYLDDAYVVGSIYWQTLRQISPEHLRYLPNHQDISEQIESWLEITRSVIPKESAQIDRMIREISGGDLKTLESLLKKSQ